jgi:hypothetical protein
MNLSFTLFDEFGSFCADGEKAARFRFERIDPLVETAALIHFDLAGARNMSSSFCNALLANLISQDGQSVIQKVRFANCRSNIRVMIESAIELGMTRLFPQRRTSDRGRQRRAGSGIRGTPQRPTSATTLGDERFGPAA